MPAKASGEIKTRIIRQAQKNGDIYLLERQYQYDPEKKYNRIISSKLIGKIPKDSETPVPTRPKRSKKTVADDEKGIPGSSETVISASRKRIGMMDILAHIGEASGIDNALYGCTDTGTAQKIISIARYLVATDGQTLPGITTWQLNHPIPYGEGLTEDIYHDLFLNIGLDEGLQQNFFRIRCEELDAGSGIAYDSSTFSTYSENQIEARYGFNKAGDGLKTIKYLTLYSLEHRQPVAFTKEPGDLPDVLTISNALRQLQAIGILKAEVITDNGYYSEKNLSELFQQHFDFITLAKVGIKWIRPGIDCHQDDFGRLSSTCPFDPATHGITLMMMKEFSRTRKYANRKTGAPAGTKETFSRRIYLHIFYNASRKADEDNSFDRGLLELRKMLQEGVPEEELSDAAKAKVKKYFILTTRGRKTTVNFNEKACAEAKKYHGYFALVSNKEKDTFRALSKYRKREHIEDYFRSAKQHTESTRIRVWDPETLRGRMFVQFVALCYYEYFSNQIRGLKKCLGKPNGEHDHDLKENLALEKKLKSWICNTPLYLQLQWFDVIEGVSVSSAICARRWSTEATARDRLYLEKLGVKHSD